ncbi:NADH-quinone oxidoreductase subunit NuoE [bacterium]|nr:NADH-quinone oxidoreductase subunit NuoE [bacterium]
MRSELTEVFLRHTASRSDLIPIIQDAQDAIGWLPLDVLQDVAAHLGVPEAQVFGVATFYAQFHLTPQGKHRVRLCRGTACHVRGSAHIHESVQRKLGVKEGETTPDQLFTYETVACVGCCALSPVIMIDDSYHGRTSPEKADAVLDEYMAQAR